MHPRTGEDAPPRVEESGDPELSLYLTFTRGEWARLRAATPLTLTEADLEEVRGINDRLSLDEVRDIYLPLSRLLNRHVKAMQLLHRATHEFLGHPGARVPYVLAIAGSVAVGKSTIARLLQLLLSRWPEHPKVDLVTTDGFLYPTRVLEAQGLMRRKGFPESYDVRRLLRFVADIKSGAEEVTAPVYSHRAYDIVPGAVQVVRRPDIVILEGLNVLQGVGRTAGRGPRTAVSDFFDFSVFVDADEADLEAWYVDRFLQLRETAYRDPSDYFHAYSRLSPEEARAVAQGIWREINAVNLRENILPTRDRARLVLEKGSDHGVRRVRMRKL
ncbi:MAG: type I pantothenate kinase [Gemmatimonadaceae bacterium]|nr:type I pantothenate kinase [Gemmatimonadaceae bacterium]